MRILRRFSTKEKTSEVRETRSPLNIEVQAERCKSYDVLRTRLRGQSPQKSLGYGLASLRFRMWVRSVLKSWWLDDAFSLGSLLSRVPGRTPHVHDSRIPGGDPSGAFGDRSWHQRQHILVITMSLLRSPASLRQGHSLRRGVVQATQQQYVALDCL